MTVDDLIAEATRKSKRKPLPKKSKPSATDAALVRECVIYAQAFAAVHASFAADPDGDSKYAEPMSAPYGQLAAKTLAVITKTKAKSANGLSAKARIVPMIIKDAANSLNEREEEFFISFAADVKAYLEPALYDQWATENGIKKAEPATVTV